MCWVLRVAHGGPGVAHGGPGAPASPAGGAGSAASTRSLPSSHLPRRTRLSPHACPPTPTSPPRPSHALPDPQAEQILLPQPGGAVSISSELRSAKGAVLLPQEPTHCPVSLTHSLGAVLLSPWPQSLRHPQHCWCILTFLPKNPLPPSRAP